MVARDDLRDSENLKMRRETDKARSRTPAGFSSLTRPGSRLRVKTEDGILVESVGGLPGLRVSGLQLVDGVLRITGTLEGVGEFEWEGPWTLSGDGDISGNVDITGILNLLSDLIVAAAGRIVIEGADGDMVLTDSKQTFGNGAEVRAPGSGGLRLTYGTTNIFLDGSSAIVTSGTRRVIVTSSGFQFFNVPTKTAVSTGLTAGAAHLDPSGNLFRIT